jgi:excisionase family DNA binding protein
MLKPLDVHVDEAAVGEVIEVLAAHYRERLKAQGGLMSTGQAADLLGVSCATVKRWCDSGKLECAKTPGGHRKIRAWSLAQVLKANPHPDDPIPFVIPPGAVIGVDLAAKADDSTAVTKMRMGEDGKMYVDSIDVYAKGATNKAIPVGDGRTFADVFAAEPNNGTATGHE